MDEDKTHHWDSRSEIEIAGSANWIDQVLTLLIPPGDNKSDKAQIESTIIHELIHYFQYVTTLDGIYWFLEGVRNSDNLRMTLKDYSGSIKIPINVYGDKTFNNVCKSFLSFIVNGSLLMSNNPNLSNSNIDLPFIKISNDKNMILTSLHLYEAFARTNQLLWIENNIPPNLSNKIINEIPVLPEYEWHMYLKDIGKDTDAMTLLCLIDLALMRPIFNVDLIENYMKVIPSWRFMTALDYVCENQISVEPTPNSHLEFQERICSELEWETPRKLSEYVLDYANEIEGSFSSIPHNFDKEISEKLDEVSEEEIENMKKFQEHRIKHIIKGLELRLNDEMPYFFFLTPCYFMDYIIENLSPSLIRTSSGYKLLKGKMSLMEIGMHEHHSYKISNAIDLLLNKSVICHLKRMSVKLPGDCDFDCTCPGELPRSDGKVPDCIFADWVEKVFHISLNNIKNT